jgi:hypothetical protein
MKIARGKDQKVSILSMFLRSACCAFALLPALCLSGCADTMPEGKPLKRFTEMVRGYDHTLTKSEKKAVIDDLQQEKERQQTQIGEDGAAKN